jgi:hypothetical protein
VTATTHADIACRLAATLPPGVFGRGARDAITHQDFVMLERLFPGVCFTTRKTGPDEWELAGVCEDGSTALWQVGA